MEPPEKGKAASSRQSSGGIFTRRALVATIAAPLIAAGTLAYGARGGARQIQLRKADIPVEGLRPELNGLTIGILSDTHCDHEAALECAHAAAALVASLQPDVIAFLGDLTTHNPHRWARAAAAAIAPAAGARFGSFAVLGNHDWWGGAPDLVARELTRAGFVVLRNQARPVAARNGLWMVGLDSRCQSHHDLARATAGVPDEKARLLLIHEPDYADEAPPGFLLQLSGHSHGGQVRLPWLPPLHTPRHARRHVEGLCQGEAHPVYVSRGVGTVGVKLRLFCPPEVNILRLVHAPNTM